jgi:uncharacterized membrane protein
MNKQRFEGFSDSVFAFAITLLVLGVALPQAHYASNATLSAALAALWPNVLAYILSFAVIGLMWQNHHALFRLVETIDRKTILLNLALLGGVAFIPFVTSTLGSYPTMPASTFLYGTVLTLCAIANNLMILHLVRSRAFHGNVDDSVIAQAVRAYREALITYLVAAIVALFAPIVSFAGYLAIVIYFLIPRGIDSDLKSTP